MRQLLVVACLSMVLLLTFSVPQGSAQGCQLSITADPPLVHYPYALPQGGGAQSFGEILDANYSSSLAGQTITVQYQNGSRWLYLENFTANGLGFTETTLGLTSPWAQIGRNTLRATTSSCASGSASFSIVVDSTAVTMDVLAYLVLILLGIVFYLVGKWAGLGFFLATAAAVYLILAPFTGQRYDMYFLMSSGIRVLQHVNPWYPGNPPLYPGALKWAYPPLYTVYSALSFLVFQALTGASLPSVTSLTWPGYLTSTYNVWLAYVPKFLPVLALLLKLPMIGSALGTGYLLLKMTGKKSAAIFWIANPLVILVAAVWGQLDPVATLLAVAAVYYYNRGKPYHAYLMASLGAAVKIWPLLLIPLFFVGSLEKEGRKAFRPLLGAIPALAATLSLYAAFGSLAQSLFVFLYARGIPSFAGQLSVNGLTWQQVLSLVGSPPVPVFLILGIPLYAIMLAWIYRHGGSDITKWMVVSILIFYLTYNYVNPQYFYWILPFLILQERRVAAWLFTALPMAYVVLSYNIFYFVSPAILFGEFSTGPSIVEQLKLGYFYSMPGQYVLISAAVPTLLYLALLRYELGKSKGKSAASTTRMEASSGG